MNILYVLDWQGNRNGGVALKVHNQLEAWAQLGNSVKIVNICRSGAEIPEGNFVIAHFKYNSKFERFKARWMAFKYIVKDNQADIIYRRYGIFLPFEIILMCFKPHVIELNTNNDFFYRQRGIIPWIMHKLQKVLVGKISLGACAVTGEIQRLHKTIFSKLETFTNGIDITNHFERNLVLKNRYRFVFLAGDDFSWNGFSKLESIASTFEDSDFYILGNVKFKSSHKNIFVIDYLIGQELSDFLTSSTFGISTLALENTGLTEAAPLKNRTYLYHGLPIIGSSPDAGFQNFSEFFFKIVFDDSLKILNISELKEFCRIWKSKKIEPFHLDQIDINKIEAQRLKFFMSLLT